MAQRKTKTILFPGSGNYLAGRCAEALFDSVAGKMGLAWAGSSNMRAVDAVPRKVGPLSPAALNALNALGLRATDDLAHAPASLSDQVTIPVPIKPGIMRSSSLIASY